MDAQWYEIRVRGELGADWTDWFDRLEIRRENENETILTGPVIDQADLHGRLARIRNLNLELISVTSIAPPDDPSVGANKRRDP